MILNIFSLAITFLVNFSLAIFVFLKNPKNPLHHSFSLFSLSIALWTGSIALGLITGNPFWAEMAFVFGSFVAGTLLLFVSIFRQKPKWQKKYLLLLIPTFVFALIAFLKTDLLISNVRVVGASFQPSERGVLYPIFGLYLISYLVATVIILKVKLAKAKGLYRYQIRYLILGIFSFAFLALITNLLLPWIGINDFNSLGPLFSVIMAGLISYSILRYRFLEIKIVVETIFTFVLSLLIALLIGLFFQNILEKTSLFSGTVIEVGVILAALLIFPSVKKITSKTVESINRPSFQIKNSIRELAQDLTRLIDLEEIIRTISSAITNSLKVTATAVVIFDRDDVQIYSVRPYPAELPNLLKQGPVIRYLNDFRSPLVTQEAQLLADPERKENFMSKVAEVIAMYPIEVYLPLIHQNKLIGVMTLDKKVSGEAFSKREIEMLETLAYQAAIAISNGKLYKEIKDLNQNLKTKVKEQTKHLDRLLNLKEEFLKITSHQLRTPVTIVKGMLSMVLEGSVDRDPSKKRQFLEQAFSSVQNLERVIHGILDASDLAAGKLMMDFEPVDLKEIVDRLIEERSHLAKEKKLDLRFESPIQTLPPVSADRLKIREAIANLIDNAIRYTPQGEICVNLESSIDHRWVTVCVKDTGIGVKPEDKKRIFKKFARTASSTLINPNGSGLGLYLVKEIIDAHRGHIEVDSAGENKGSIFKITIPAKK